jgi:hypothetical protein
LIQKTPGMSITDVDSTAFLVCLMLNVCILHMFFIIYCSTSCAFLHLCHRSTHFLDAILPRCHPSWPGELSLWLQLSGITQWYQCNLNVWQSWFCLSILLFPSVRSRPGSTGTPYVPLLCRSYTSW